MFLAAMKETQEDINKDKLTGLAPFVKGGLVVTRGRLGKGLFRVLGVSELPIIVARLPLAHKEDHRGHKTTLWRSRAEAWIVKGTKLAREVERGSGETKINF